MSQFTLFITINLNSYRVQKLCYPEGFSFFWLGEGENRSTYCLELTGDFVMEREGRQQCILWKSSVYFVYTLCILSWWVVYSEAANQIFGSIVVKYTIFDIPWPKAFQKYILYGVRMVNFVICAWPELFNFPAPTAKFGSKLPDQNWSAPRQN